MSKIDAMFLTVVFTSFFLILEQEKEEPSKALLPASAPKCNDLEKQALEIELQRQESQRHQNESKMTWKQWFKNPDFYKVKIQFSYSKAAIKKKFDVDFHSL